jgi:hypothetical protein
MNLLKALPLPIALFTFSASSLAAITMDRHGNVGYDTLAECEAAVQSGTAKFYKSATSVPPLLREGETSFKVMKLSEAPIPGFPKNIKGVCDVGAPRKLGRDGVSKPLQGKYVPYSPDFDVNVYFNAEGQAKRVSMQMCDNWFSGNFPQGPILSLQPASVQPSPAPAPVATVAPPAPAPVVAAPPAPVPPAVAPVTPAVAATAAVGGISTPALIGIVVGVGAAVGGGGGGGGGGTTGTTGTR